MRKPRRSSCDVHMFDVCMFTLTSCSPPSVCTGSTICPELSDRWASTSCCSTSAASWRSPSRGRSSVRKHFPLFSFLLVVRESPHEPLLHVLQSVCSLRALFKCFSGGLDPTDVLVGWYYQLILTCRPPPLRSTRCWSRTGCSSGRWWAERHCTSCAVPSSWPRRRGREDFPPTSPPTRPSPTWATCWARPASACSLWWGTEPPSEPDRVQDPSELPLNTNTSLSRGQISAWVIDTRENCEIMKII